jgi:hypothetical protein
MHSPSLATAASFTMSPTMDQLLMFGNDRNASPYESPSLSPLEFGSAPVSFPMLDLQNSLVQDSLYFNTMSHSLPGSQYPYIPTSPIATSFGAIQEQEEDQVWMGELLMRGGSTAPYSLSQANDSHASSSTTEDVDLNHVPSGWATAAPSMVRTESVFSVNSVGSYASVNSFDDFRVECGKFKEYQSDSFQHSPMAVDQKPTINGDWSSNASANGSIDDAATPRAVQTSKNPGRKGKLTQEQRDHAAYIRRIGACKMCRLRRAKVSFTSDNF